MWLLGVGGGVMTGMLKRLVLDGLQFHFISGERARLATEQLNLREGRNMMGLLDIVGLTVC